VQTEGQTHGRKEERKKEKKEEIFISALRHFSSVLIIPSYTQNKIFKTLLIKNLRIGAVLNTLVKFLLEEAKIFLSEGQTYHLR
jgi:hypothetical protein